ncbi:unnamed protein product [Ceutorhynchus assimilis]|uniref:Hyaluronidase n=1 Tax=Ceutorhynchus assimilis TaxID=467358 RepID=A0A9N9MP84_9CUCU|nr:unnamed protein product [Ceutorhynchus assimilis]
MSAFTNLISCIILLGLLEELSSHEGKSHQNPSLKVIWNIKSLQCASHGFDFAEILKSNNIIHNEHGSFNGNVINLLYDPGKFPAILMKNNQEYLRNGGVPQEGNLNEHLESFEKVVEQTIPDLENHGLAVIDHENWKAIYRQNNWGKYIAYQTLSENKEKKKHPKYSNERIIEEASKTFEDAAFKFIEETIKLGKSLRPNSQWGYYHYPYCFANGKTDTCHRRVMEENDRLRSLFEISDVLYPSLYLQEENTSEERARFIRASLDEAIRVKNKLQRNKKIYVYYWYKYQDSENFISKEELTSTLKIIASYNIDGLILWGANADVNTSPKCGEVYEYINNTFGPTLRNV